jgi:hypothetical protein
MIRSAEPGGPRALQQLRPLQAAGARGIVRAVVIQPKRCTRWDSKRWKRWNKRWKRWNSGLYAKLVDEQFARGDGEDVPTARVVVAEKPLN